MAVEKSKTFTPEMDRHLRDYYACRVDPAIMAYVLARRYGGKGATRRISERTVRARLCELGILRRNAWREP